jgi:hypothetical protein
MIQVKIKTMLLVAVLITLAAVVIQVFDDDILRGDLVARMTLYAGGRITSEAGTARENDTADGPMKPFTKRET